MPMGSKLGSKCQNCEKFKQNGVYFGVLPRGHHVFGVKNGVKSTVGTMGTRSR